MAYGDSSFIPTSSTVVYYKMNGGVTDSSASANNGTPTNISYINGRFLQAASFNGTNSFIQSSAVVTTGTSATFSFWIYRLDGNDQCYFIEDTYSNNSMCFLSGGSIFYRFGGTNNLSSSILPTLNAWSCVTITHTGTTGTMFINGVQVATGTVNSKTGSGSSLTLGKLSTLNIYYLNGYMDDMIVENRAWTAKQVQQYYSNAIGRYQTTII